MTLTNLIPGVSQAKAIVGGIMVAGILALGVWVWRVDGLRAQHLADLHTAQAQFTAESNAHRVTLASLAQCQSTLAEKSAESDARAKAYSDAQAQDQANTKANDAKQRATDGQRAALEAIAKVPGGSVPCKVPGALAASLKGL
jgi:hypothetical protein